MAVSSGRVAVRNSVHSITLSNIDYQWRARVLLSASCAAAAAVHSCAMHLSSQSPPQIVLKVVSAEDKRSTRALSFVASWIVPQLILVGCGVREVWGSVLDGDTTLLVGTLTVPLLPFCMKLELCNYRLSCTNRTVAPFILSLEVKDAMSLNSTDPYNDKLLTAQGLVCPTHYQNNDLLEPCHPPSYRWCSPLRDILSFRPRPYPHIHPCRSTARCELST